MTMNEADYRAALAACEELMKSDPMPDTPEGHTLLLLAIGLEQYEREHFTMELPSNEELAAWRKENVRE
jgi:antitoxin component HigA of HigAB toxin-antitoxin module